MPGAQVHWVNPSFTLRPDNNPPTVLPPAKERSLRAPFGIDEGLFHSALRPEVPLVFAAVYIVTVFSLNAFNRSRQWKPWWIARQWWFNWFVVLHNSSLALYSALTFWAMCHAIHASLPSFLDWRATPVTLVDALCRMNGPRGFGDAVVYNTTLNIWESKNALIRTAPNGSPDSSDVGRIWNEGLAFWGWLFYISKFYEVIDTGIIIAKGRRSATLQTYHHSGAMLCMWAGIRYMSPPIWMFVFVNSFIHALMYTYYTLSAVGVKVHPRLKRTLTSMQIFQFIWGATFAAGHLVIQYDIPVSTPYQVASTFKAAAANVGAAAAAAGSGVSKILQSPAADGTLAATLKKLLLRAAGEEGIAELVDYQKGEPLLAQIENPVEQIKTIFETRWRTEYTKVDCIYTQGQAFAVWLNLFYLAPLTFLFARFFVKAYTRWGKSATAPKASEKAVEASKEAKDRTETAVEQAGKHVEARVERIGHQASEVSKKSTQEIRQEVTEEVQAKTEEVKSKAEEIQAQVRKDFESFKSGTFSQNVRNFSSSSTTQSTSFSSSEQITSTTHFTAEDESESKQESNLEASFDVRPGIEGDAESLLKESSSEIRVDTEDDTDAMGRSGAIIEEAETGGLLPPTPSKE